MGEEEYGDDTPRGRIWMRKLSTEVCVHPRTNGRQRSVTGERGKRRRRSVLRRMTLSHHHGVAGGCALHIFFPRFFARFCRFLQYFGSLCKFRKFGNFFSQLILRDNEYSLPKKMLAILSGKTGPTAARFQYSLDGNGSCRWSRTALHPQSRRG